MLTKSALWVHHLWIWLGGALVWFRSVHQVCCFGDSWEGICCKPRSASISALLEAAWWELQYDLPLVATCAGLRGTW